MILRWVTRLGVAVAISATLVIGWVVWDTHEAIQTQDGAVHTTERVLAAAKPVAHPDRFTGLVRIPRLGADWVKAVRLGVDQGTLALGLGYYPGSVAPGTPGNVLVAGHRSGHGNPLLDIDTVVPGDQISLQTTSGTFTYQVTGHVIVDPSDVGVLRHSCTGQCLVLTTCSPRWGNSQRYVVFAVRS